MCEIIKNNEQFNSWYDANDEYLFMGTSENLRDLDIEVDEHIDLSIRLATVAEQRLNFGGAK